MNEADRRAMKNAKNLNIGPAQKGTGCLLPIVILATLVWLF